MYLIHLGAILLIGQRLSGPAAAAVSFAATLAYAITSWHLIEKKLLRA
jgi:peptidoglycan/LPS O-acetylase OafA/YrhL